MTNTRIYTFDDMRLKVGDKINLELPAQMSKERIFVKVVGFIKETSLMVTIPNKIRLLEGDQVIMRYFCGRIAFGFSCTIERIIRATNLAHRLHYEYLHLSIPKRIEGVEVRKVRRAKTRIIVSVNDDKQGAEKKVSALISDISPKGVSLGANQALGKKGDILNLVFRVPFQNTETYMSLQGAIRAVNTDKVADVPESSKFHHGIEFQDVQPNDGVALQNITYQQMIENPNKLE